MPATFGMPGHPHCDAIPGVRTVLREGPTVFLWASEGQAPSCTTAIVPAKTHGCKCPLIDKKTLGFVEDLEVFTHCISFLGWP